MGYLIAPWELRWAGLDLDALQRTESTFALSNGHIGLRGSLEEGEPRGLPGTYLNGFYEEHPLPYAEAGYGYPEAGQTVVNVTDGKIIRLLVQDEPLPRRGPRRRPDGDRRPRARSRGRRGRGRHRARRRRGR